MKKLLTIIIFLTSAICYGQKDSTDTATITVKQLQGYLERINLVAMKQFNLTEQGKYQEILKELQAILSEAEKKKRNGK